MTQDEFLCAKNLTREPAPTADATSAQLMGATILDESKIKSFGLYLVLRAQCDVHDPFFDSTRTSHLTKSEAYEPVSGKKSCASAAHDRQRVRHITLMA